MIKPINNNLNFKGYVIRPDMKYSKKQEQLIDTIRTSLNDETRNHSYEVSAGAIIDSIELWEYFETKKGLKKIHIGTYDEAHPFKKSDCTNNEQKKSSPKFKLNNLAGTLLAIGMIALGSLMITKCVQSTKQQAVKNSIQRTGTTLNILK